MMVTLLKTILNQIPGFQKMGLIFSTHYFTDVIDTVKRAQSNIVSLRSHGDAAWLQLQKVLERFETLKFNLYSRTCTKCRPLVKEIMGDVQTKNNSLADVLPPDKQMLLRGIVRTWIEMEMPQSGHTDVSDIDISRLQEFLLDDRYVKVELERDTAVVSRTVIEKELRELQKKDKNMQDRIDELETVLKKRTQEGSKLKTKNTQLNDALDTLKAKLDAQNKSFVRAEEMTNSQTSHDTVKNNVLHVASGGQEHKEEEHLEGVLIENERLKEENTKYTKEMLTLTETNAVLQDQLKKAETRAEKSEMLLTELRMERQDIQELLDKSSCSIKQSGVKDKEHVIAGIRQLQQANKKISLEADRLQREIGTKMKELQTEKADIDELSKAKLLLEKENEDKTRQIHELSVQVVKLNEQLKIAETLAKKSETALVKFKAEQKDIQEREIPCETEQTGGMDIEALKTKNNLLQEANKTLSSTVDRLKHDLGVKEDELQEVQDNANTDIQALSKTKQMLEEEYAKLLKENAALTERNELANREQEQIQEVSEKQIKQLQDEIAIRTREVDISTEENNRLKEFQKTLENKIETLHKELTSSFETKNEMEMTLATISKGKAQIEEVLNKQVLQVQDENNQLKQDITNATEETIALKRTISSSEDENKTLNEKIASISQTSRDREVALKAQEMKAQEVRDELDKQIKQLQEENSKYANENSNSEEEIKNLKRTLTSVSNSRDELETIVRTLESEKEEITHRLTKRLEELTDSIDVLRQENNNLEQDLKRKTEDLDTSLIELREARKKTVVMGLRIEKSGMGKAMVDMVYKELTKRLQTILEKDDIAITVQLCQTHAEVPSGPLVVLCLNMSRVGTNMLDALKGIKADRDVYVLVLHNTVKENLPQLTPTGLRVTDSVLRQLGGIFDMAFNSDTGVYDCELNNSTTDKMATTLKKYSK
ncbi:putative leucine-rich repeat-containing protein DDB_G0290503 isoform X2 [Argopecten irradians]